MKAKQGFGHGYNAQRLVVAAVFGCVLVPIVFLALVKSNSHQFAILSLQLSIHTYGPLSTTEEEGGMKQTDSNLTSLQPLQLRVVQERNDSIISIDNESIKFPLPPNERPDSSSSRSGIGARKAQLEQNEKQDDDNRSIIDIQLTKQPLDVQNGNKTVIDNNEKEVIQVTKDQKQEQNYAIESFNSTDESSIVSEKTELVADLNEKQSENNSVIVTENMKQDQNKITVGNNATQESKLECDFSGTRSDTCTMLGDIRVLSKNSTIIISSPLSTNSTTMKIRPYARKWESSVMEHIKEVSITPLSESGHVPTCSLQHSVPAVIFSTGGFLGNFFHDFTDVLVPLFTTSRHFQGEVQFLVIDYNSKWIAKYKPILNQLSRYEIIDMDSETQVHCFPEVQLGLQSHKVLGMDPSKTPNGYSMLDFKQFLRSCFNLNKGSTNQIPKKSRKKPRLLIILRRGSRSLTNAKEVVSMGRSVGFKVVTAGPEDTMDLAKFAKTVNSADVMVGVHGAGLANMVFLPTNASLVQIIPWGGLKWACRHDFGEPASDMGLNYVEYEIKEEESSLIEEYPRDHAVFKDPMSIHRQGWNQLWSIFLDKQKVKLDVGRFRDVLLEIYQSLKN